MNDITGVGIIMDKNSFTVTSSKSEKISGILIFLIVCVPLSIAGLIMLENLILKIICICLFALGVFVVLSSFLITLTVEGDVLKGRTISARKFELKISEIRKVYCSAMKSERKLPGSGYFIRMNSDKRIIKVTHGMACFEKLAEYIIEKCDDNTLSNEIIDDESRKSLKSYLSVWNDKNNK